MSQLKQFDVVEANASEDSIEEVAKSTWWRKALGYIWDSAEGTPQNRKYVQKLDAYML